MSAVEALLIFPVAAFDLTIMARGKRFNDLMLDAQTSSSSLKKGWLLRIMRRKAVSEFEAVISLHTFNRNAMFGKKSYGSFKKDSRGISTMLLKRNLENSSIAVY